MNKVLQFIDSQIKESDSADSGVGGQKIIQKNDLVNSKSITTPNYSAGNQYGSMNVKDEIEI